MVKKIIKILSGFFTGVFKMDLEKKIKEYGKNVEINSTFIRHGEKDKKGNLTSTGAEQTQEYGTNLDSKDAIKAYSSSIQRVIDTTKNIVNSAPHKKKLKTRIRKELGIPKFSEKFMEAYEKYAKDGMDDAADWYFNLGNKKFDKNSPTTKELAASFAYVLQNNIKMSKKLYSDSKVDLINRTHQNLPECLLKEIMIRNINGKKITGFKSIKEIGGLLGYAEPINFKIKRDNSGKTYITLNFRKKEYDVDIKKLNELANSYSKKTNQPPTQPTSKS